jgi:hypothetical protein
VENQSDTVETEGEILEYRMDGGGFAMQMDIANTQVYEYELVPAVEPCPTVASLFLADGIEFIYKSRTLPLRSNAFAARDSISAIRSSLDQVARKSISTTPLATPLNCSSLRRNDKPTSTSIT